MPGYQYHAHGPSSVSFDAVVLNIHPGVAEAVRYEPAWSDNPRLTWARLGAHSAALGFYIPPRRAGANEEERRRLLAKVFQQMRRVREELATEGSTHMGTIIACGDLSPSHDIMPMLMEELADIGMANHMPADVPTHVKGGMLDVIFANRRQGLNRPPWVHDGKHCLNGGCEGKMCGSRSEVWGTRNFDHHPVTY